MDAQLADLIMTAAMAACSHGSEIVDSSFISAVSDKRGVKLPVAEGINLIEGGIFRGGQDEAINR